MQKYVLQIYIIKVISAKFAGLLKPLELVSLCKSYFPEILKKTSNRKLSGKLQILCQLFKPRSFVIAGMT